MPALPTIVHGFLVTQHWNHTVQLHGMVNRFAVVDNSSPITPSAVANKVALAYANRFMPLFDGSYTLGQTDVLPLDGVSSTQTYTTPSAGVSGGHNTGNALPNAVSAVVAWQTGLKGRSKRGRSYLMTPNSDQVVDVRGQTPTTAFITALQAAATAFISDLASLPNEQLQLVVLSRKLGTVQNVITARADALLHTQRRRYEKVARH
jgi:hypothetical protein